MDRKLRKMYLLVGRKSQLSLYNKLIVYKVIIKSVWAYGIQLWEAACNSNLDTIQRFQSKTLRRMLDAPWYVTNAAIHRDLEKETVKKEIERCSESYEKRLRTHLNKLATNLLNRYLVVRRPKKFKSLDLRDRFQQSKPSCRNQNQRIRHHWTSTLNCNLFDFVFNFILLSSLSEKWFIVIVNCQGK